MTTFEERQKGFEKKFEKDQELQFKATARRNKLLGLWAAQLMGVKDEAAESYAREVVRADFETPGEEDVFRKVYGDLHAKALVQSEGQVRRKMEELFAIAREQIMTEVKK
jgi:hypothetical protein